MIRKITHALAVALLALSCQSKQPAQPDTSVLKSDDLEQVITDLTGKYPGADKSLVEKGVRHAASLWRESDGDAATFKTFCANHFYGDAETKDKNFVRLGEYFEAIYGHLNEMRLKLLQNVDLQRGETLDIDPMFAAYSLGSHLSSDFYDNKIAFIVALNFPYYTTEEKNQLGPQWDSRRWGYARMGDLFQSRVPSSVVQNAVKVSSEAEAYIAGYNIYMGHVLSESGAKLFPADMMLLSHWNLRDEIKSNYANKENGLEKQGVVYRVMQRIIDQSIPKEVINSEKQDWNPFTNTVSAGDATPENDGRYQQILNNFHVFQEFDRYNPAMNTQIERAFSGEMEIPQTEIVQLFDQFLSSPQVAEVASLIKSRLGRDLQPWDIWYDGFKSRSSINEETLNDMTEKRYPNPQAFEADMERMLIELQFPKEKAAFLAAHIAVDPARGSGHAWGAQMKGEKARLRTRIPATGMNYKGYNIAVHEFGHNVEQTISLHDVDNYLINGVPNTAFTEALAFTFQDRDLFLLGMNDQNPQKDALKTLDIFWSVYEIMGVSMVDMKMWQWLYAHPQATATELRDAVLQISKEVWNQYYAPVFGQKDQTILAIYSHMINSPMYLPNYAIGHLIHFQLEEYFRGKELGPEVSRIFAIGRRTPNEWMQKAIGGPLSSESILKAASAAAQQISSSQQASK